MAPCRWCSKDRESALAALALNDHEKSMVRHAPTGRLGFVLTNGSAEKRRIPLRVVWSARSLRNMKGLSEEMRRRVAAAVERYAESGEGDVKRLQGTRWCRLRVGDWRVVIELLFSQGVLTVVRVFKRGDGY